MPRVRRDYLRPLPGKPMLRRQPANIVLSQFVARLWLVRMRCHRHPELHPAAFGHVRLL